MQYANLYEGAPIRMDLGLYKGRERESAKFHYTIQTIQSNLTRSITFPSHTTVCFLCATSSRPVLSQCHSALLHSTHKCIVNN